MKVKLLSLFFILLLNTVFCQKKSSDKNSKEYKSLSSQQKNIADLFLQSGEYIDQEKYDLAIIAYEKALVLYEKSFGKEHISYATLLERLAWIYYKTNNYDKAFSLFLKSLDLIEEKVGKESSKYLNLLKQVSFIYKNLGQYDKAIPLLLEAIKITEDTKGNTDSSYLTLVNNLIVLYLDFNQYEKVEPLLLKLSKVYTKYENINQNSYPYYLLSLAHYYKNTGQYQNSLISYQKALEWVEKKYDKEHPDYDDFIGGLALLYKTIGQYEKAQLLYMEALTIVEKKKGKNHQKYLSKLNNLANLYRDQGLYKKALSLQSKVLKYFRENSLEDSFHFGILLNNFALSNEILGKYEEAILAYTEAKENSEKNLEDKSIKYATIINNLACLYQSTKEYEKAIPLYLRALEIIKENLGENHIDYGSVLYNIAMSYSSVKDQKKALYFLEEANNATINLIKKSFIYQTEHEKQNFLQNALGEGLSFFSNFNYQTEEKQSKAIKLSLNNILISKELILSSSKNVLVSLQSLQQDSLKKKIDLFRIKKESVNKQFHLPLNKRRKDFSEIQKELAKLERDLVVAYSERFGEEISYIKDYKKTLLKENELAIEFVNFRLYNKTWTDSTMYVAYIYKKNWETPKAINLFEERQLKKYLTSSTSPNRLYTSRGGELVDKKGILADSIYNLVWKPLEPYVQNSSAIYYSPDGLLHKIPFAVLPNKENKLLGERYNLNQMGNTADIRKNSKLPNLDDVLLIGGVDYTYTIPDSKKNTITPEDSFSILQSDQLLGDDNNKKRSSGVGSWEYLRGTAIEIKAIKKLLPKSKILTQKEATETAFKNLSGNSPSVLHIATHGYFFPDLKKKKDDFRLGNEKAYIHSENPLLRSGLILANADYAWKHGSNPYEEEDGILTALEISNLNLRNTDIVILSACETGLGDIPSSEGVYGLQRAFKMAGVETIVMTLWEVPDIETAEFMNLFYTKWKASNNPKKAFKETQKIMMNRYRNDPVKWAGFVYFQ